MARAISLEGSQAACRASVTERATLTRVDESIAITPDDLQQVYKRIASHEHPIFPVAAVNSRMMKLSELTRRIHCSVPKYRMDDLASGSLDNLAASTLDATTKVIHGTELKAHQPGPGNNGIQLWIKHTNHI